MAASGLVTIPAGCLGSSHLSSTERWTAAQCVHELARASARALGSDITNSSELIHVARVSGNIGTVRVSVITAPAGGNQAFTVDLHKSTGGGAFASVLSSAYTVDNSKTNSTTYTISPSNPTYAAGDIFKVVWIVSGSTGNQAQGAIAEVFFEEATA